MKEKRTGSRRGAAGMKLAGRVRFPPGAIRGKPNPKEYALRQKKRAAGKPARELPDGQQVFGQAAFNAKAAAAVQKGKVKNNGRRQEN